MRIELLGGSLPVVLLKRHIDSEEGFQYRVQSLGLAVGLWMESC